MSIFDSMLRSDESLFLDSVALDFDFIPNPMQYREKEQQHIAYCIRPLTAQRTGKNLLIHGPPGIGKTAAVKNLFKEIEEKYDDIIPIYINVWQKNTSFKLIIEICEKLDYRFTHNKKTEELFEVVKQILNKKSVVFCLDEVDKLEDIDALYMILEQIYRKTVILITNYKEWAASLDERIRSRLALEMLEFRKYNASEIRGIMLQRIKYAFVPGVWEDAALDTAIRKTTELGDVRLGLSLLREAGNLAEDRASRKIEVKDIQAAIDKLSDVKIKDPSTLKEDEQKILDLVKDNSGKKIGDLYQTYKDKGGEGVYKTFQRKIDFLSRNKFISTKKQTGGPDGTTTIVKYERETKLDEF